MESLKISEAQRAHIDVIYALTEKIDNCYNTEIAEVLLIVAGRYLHQQGFTKRSAQELMSKALSHPLSVER